MEIWRNAQQADQLNNQIILFSSVSKIKSEIERERDLATSYLGGGNDLLDVELQTQRLDLKIEAFKNTLKSLEVKKEEKKRILDSLANLKTVRTTIAEIDSSTEEIETDAESIIFEYDDIVSPLLRVEHNLVQLVKFKGIGKLLSGIILLEETKSNLGKKQGIIAGILAEDEPIDSDMMNVLLKYQFNIDNNLSSNALFISSENVEAIKQFRIKKHWNIVADVFDVLVDNADTGDYGVSATQYLEYSQLALADLESIILFELDSHKSMASRIQNNSTQLILLYLLIISLMTLTIIYLTRKISALITQPIDSMAKVMARVNDSGDLTLRVPVSNQDEIGRSTEVFNNLLASHQDSIRSVNETLKRVLDSIDIMQSELRFTSQMTLAQQHSTDHIAITVKEISAGADNVATTAEQVASVSQIVDEQAKKGMQIVEKTEVAINDLSVEVSSVATVVKDVEERSNEISTVLNVIKGISEQTNLLALNAAIEAARAGESGRGFAVVADEVRTLAQRTNESANQIENTIESLLSGVTKAVHAVALSQSKGQEGVKQTQLATTTLDSIALEIDRLVESISEIASAATEQSYATNDISGHLDNILGQAKNTTKATESSFQVCQKTIALTKELDKLLSQFIVYTPNELELAVTDIKLRKD